MELREALILLVDDDPAAIHTMRHLLSDFPNLRFANSGEDALRLARACRPDLVVLDAQMPGMDGLQVCRAMRADAALAGVPVIMATATRGGEVELEARAHGVADFITKPLVPETFRARVRARLRDRAMYAGGAGALALPAPVGEGQPRDLPALLIVDDDVCAVQMLGNTLHDLGTIHFVTDGRAALDMARQLEPDLVILDARMPAVDGYAICAALKSHPRLQAVPVVFVTRYDAPAEETRALELGAADFVSKPYIAPVLRARISNLLELKRRVDAELRAAGERWRRLADARVAEVVRTASDAILVCDEAHTVLLANAAAERMFGMPATDVVGGRLADWLGDAPALARAAGGAPVRLHLRRPGREDLPVEATASVLSEGAHHITTWVLRDVGDRERLQAETVARAAAEASSEAKTRMIGVIAHELGNPLNGVLGFAQLLQADKRRPLHEAHLEWVQRIEEAGRVMQRLVDDLLEFARAESGGLSLALAPVDVAAVVADALAGVAPAAAVAGVALAPLGAPATLPPVRADQHRLRQCLANLLSNAVKYNEPGGRVDVHIEQPALDRVRITVRDDGLGMDAQQLAALFQPFNRLGRERSTRPGTGLGLVITRQLVQAMGGELQVQSAPGQGSSFQIDLATP